MPRLHRLETSGRSRQRLQRSCYDESERRRRILLSRTGGGAARKLERGRRRFQRRLRLDSDDTNAYYWRSAAKQALGSYAEALSDADQYIKANVDDADGYLLRAQIEIKLGNAAEARTSATSALRHYMIVNDQAGVAKAQALLDSLGKSGAQAPQ